jgi:hypothetical protein
MRALAKILLCLIALTASAQTTTIPASGTARRVVRGAALPATCAISDIFFKTAATVGTYECKTANTWTQIGGASGDVVGPASSANQSLAIFGSTTGKLLAGTTIAYQDGALLNLINGIVASPPFSTASISAANGNGILFPTNGIGFFNGASSTAVLTLNLSGLSDNRIITIPDAAGTLALTTSNVATASALAANPTDCSAGQFATTIAASGNLTCAAVGAATNLTVSTGVTNGTGMQHVRGASCTTGSLINASCDTTVTWPVAFANTSYTAVATLDSPSGGLVFILSTKNKTATTIDVTLITLTAAASSGTINLIGMHD